jgi:hypothetical protein
MKSVILSNTTTQDALLNQKETCELSLRTEFTE